jgi:hypothetical protein
LIRHQLLPPFKSYIHTLNSSKFHYNLNSLMTTTEHPITPPPELVEQWFMDQRGLSEASRQQIATRAAQWGADQELEACCEWLNKDWHPSHSTLLRDDRRGKPPSAKEQALFALAVLTSADETCSIAEIQQHWHTIRRALEQIDD